MTQELARIYAEVYAAAFNKSFDPAAAARAAVKDYIELIAEICPDQYKYVQVQEKF